MMTELSEAISPMPEGGPAAAMAHAGGCSCEACAGKPRSAPEQYVYALGRFDVKFPTIGIEREFQQRERALKAQQSAARGRKLRQVLEANSHLALRVAYTFGLGATPTYLVMPSSGSQRAEFLEAIERVGDTNHVSVLIGRMGPLASPAMSGGLVAPIVMADKIYTFSLDEWQKGLESSLERAVKSRDIKKDAFNEVCRELFHRLALMAENMGVTDGHRALNYLLVQHPGLFLAAAERAKRQVLDRVETRVIHGPGMRRQVAVIFTFLDSSTGVPERLFCRVDVTEEWPFVTDGSGTGSAPLGLSPYVEGTLAPSLM
ncbi:MAG: hypothetical protein E6G97_17640 [Alphaproteobacteria bacterium]|nr:MAG: hypothetical protein E6G97_17640 [Alphaproteobacteria bacterium]